MPETEDNLYDTVDTYYGCTVQILRNSITGQISIGWWQDEYDEEGCEYCGQI